MGQLGLHESYANQFLPTSRLILNSILCRGSCGSYYAHAVLSENPIRLRNRVVG